MDARTRQVLDAVDYRGKRSPLYAWMRENYEALMQAFKQTGPHWVTRTKAIEEAGLRDRSGKPATIRTVQNTWYKVCRDMRQAAEAKPADPPHPAPPQVAPAPPLPVSANTPSTPAGENPYGFRPAGGVKKWTKKESGHE